MANAAFSPKDFKAWIIKESTPGTVPTITSGLHQLDVDSVTFPSLNVNQVLDVRTQAGRILDKGDFFQDNLYKTTEVSLSGTFHNDAGHRQLMQSVTGNTLATSAGDVNLGYAATGINGEYGVAQADVTFTLVLASPDTVDGYNIIMSGCMVTNFTLSADMGTDGGVYKWSCTISTGNKPTLNNSADEDGTAYTGALISIDGLSATSVYSISTCVLSSFSVAIDSPAVYAGTGTNGYGAFARGQEIAVTAAAQVKYDADTRGLIQNFGEQGVTVDTAGAFTMTQSSATDCSISMPTGILTNVALADGDIMMMDVELKGVSNGSGSVLAFDLA
ncbi:MAG: hypothetical protein Unbinned2990contig1002_6 [Prokaryotic dsDNA virus sp.]|nr:MAG: hypothetical protein Unbinned2990contig1002_6 [Prokaryotic dsDNA virus sp.]|tara:strand:- start:9972 stop:10967 length:996 start_codon:yes stop_codon:yes gene_type:complete